MLATCIVSQSRLGSGLLMFLAILMLISILQLTSTLAAGLTTINYLVMKILILKHKL